MGTQKSQEVEWEPPGSWVFDPGGFAYHANQGQGKNVPLFLDVVDVGIGGVSPLKVKPVLLEDLVEFFRPGDVGV